MKKLITLLFTAVIGLSFISTSAFADVAKGQKRFIRLMKKPCGFDGGVMAKKHTQEEWKAFQDAGKLNDAMLEFCPNAKPVKKEKHLKDIYDFLYNYASNSGNVPSC